MDTPGRGERGFTLIELSIVLVIIGLIVGGVLVGQSVISAAAVRAQVTQLEKFNQAVNTFYGKYGYLPGDIKDPDASSFGFSARGQYQGEGDGNGKLEGNWGNCPGCNNGANAGVGENAVFWVDLSSARLIEDSFSSAGFVVISNVTTATNPSINNYYPQAKLGNGNSIYVYSNPAGQNYYGLSVVSAIGMGPIGSTQGLTVAQAYGMDKKMDDGFPQTGSVIAQYVSYSNGGISSPAGGGGVGASGTAATSGTSSTCYDNGNTLGATQQYSVEISGGSNVNCAVSFRMQAGD